MPGSRRDFLGISLGMAGSLAVLPAAGCSRPVAPPARGPNEKIRVAVIGVNGQGSAHVGEWLRTPEVDLVAVCDCDPAAYVRLCERHFKDSLRPPEIGRAHV